MKPFNLVSIEPVSYAHNGMLHEVIRYFYYMLQSCGFTVTQSVNQFDAHSINIFFNSHLIVTSDVLKRFPADSIIFNTEQLEPYKLGETWSAGGAYADLLARCTVWDYSYLNLPAIPHERKALIPLLYCPDVATDLPRKVDSDRPLLFYGSLSPSRKETLEALRAKGLRVMQLFGVYGRARDEFMMKAWAVLNLHRDIPYIENRHQFESVRCFYPLTCGVPVISDTSIDPTADYYRNSILFSTRDALVETVQWLHQISVRESDGLMGENLETFSRTSAKAIIRDAVEAFTL